MWLVLALSNCTYTSSHALPTTRRSVLGRRHVTIDALTYADAAHAVDATYAVTLVPDGNADPWTVTTVDAEHDAVPGGTSTGHPVTEAMV